MAEYKTHLGKLLSLSIHPYYSATNERTNERMKENGAERRKANMKLSTGMLLKKANYRRSKINYYRLLNHQSKVKDNLARV